jgi:hypothetical protein
MTNYTLSALPGIVYCGQQQVSVTWSVFGGTPSASDYVALFAAGGLTELWRQSTGGETAGTAQTYAPTTPGSYQFHYYDGTTNSIKATSNSFNAMIPQITLNPEPTSCLPNEPLEVLFVCSSPDAGDILGLYAVNAPSSEPLWRVNPNNVSGSTCYLTAPAAPGQYEFRYYWAPADYTATSMTVAVQESSGYSVTATPQPETAQVTVQWAAPESSSNDEIGMFPAYVEAHSSLLQGQSTHGVTQGETTFTLPDDGLYQFQYLQYGFTPQAYTAPVSLAAQQPPTAPRTATLSVTPDAVEPNVAVTVAWDSPDADPSDWVGLFRVAGQDATPTSSQPIGGGESGTLTFTAPAQEGHYDFRYYAYGTSTPAARSNLLTVITPQVSLAATPGSVPSGAEITVTWDAFNGSITDSVGLFAVTADDSSPLATEPAGVAPSGRLTFIAPDQFTEPETTGQYEFRYFYAGSDVAAARSNAVTVTLPRISLTAAPSTVEPNGELSVTWNATNTTPNDEVGLYELSDSDVSPISYHTTGGAATGSLSFIAPPDDGQYVFRYLLGGTTAAAHSDVVSVYGGEPPDTTVAGSLPDAVPRGQLEQLIINHSIHDAEWRALLISEPAAALTELFGNAPPDGLTINVIVEGEGNFYHVVPDTTGEVVPTEDAWVLHPVLPPGELESDGILGGSGSDLSGAGAPLDAGTSLPGQEMRGVQEILGGLTTLPESVGTVALVGVGPMALTSRQIFKGQLNYLLMTDSDFYSAFTSEPVQTLAEQFNFHFPEEITLTPLVESGGAVHIVLPYAPYEAIFNPPYAAEFQADIAGTIQVPMTDSLAIQDAITVEVWFKAREFHGDTDDVIASTHQSDGGWELRVGGGVPRFVVNIGGTDYVAQPGSPFLGLRPGAWYYLAGVYDGQQIQLYLNDVVLTPATAATGTIGANADYLTLGLSPDPSEGQSNFEGLIYDVRVWGEALTPDRVRSDFLIGRSETPAPEGDLRAWYPMVEGAGTTLYDHSGNTNDGTLNAVMWVSTYPDTPNQ